MTQDAYSAGLHVLMSLGVGNPESLISLDKFREFTNLLLKQHDVEEVGFSSHVFDNGSYTAAVCLRESHLCIHTWPEFKLLTLDIYLCNYLRDNSDKVRAISDAYISHFDATVINRTEVWR